MILPSPGNFVLNKILTLLISHSIGWDYFHSTKSKIINTHICLFGFIWTIISSDFPLLFPKFHHVTVKYLQFGRADHTQVWCYIAIRIIVLEYMQIISHLDSEDKSICWICWKACWSLCHLNLASNSRWSLQTRQKSRETGY